MKFTIERAALLKTLAHVQSAVDRNNTIAILSNVLLDVNDGNLKLSVTNTTLTIVDAVPVEMEEPGAITVPVNTLYGIVGKLSDKSPITIKTASNGQSIKIRSGRSVFTLATLPKEDFPNIGTVDSRYSFTLQSGDLRNMIDNTRFSISTEETRYFLCGIYLHVATDVDLDVLRAVATDGHRLAFSDVSLPEGAGDMLGVIIPSKTVSELRKLIDNTDQPIEVALSDTYIRFSFDSMVISSKLIAGEFPNYVRIIPVGNDKIVKVNCRDFANAVDRVSIIASEKAHAIKLSIEGNTLTLYSKTSVGDDAVDQISISYDGPDLDIGFNFKYLLAICQQIEGEFMELAFSNENGAAIIKDASDSRSLYLLMPMRY